MGSVLATPAGIIGRAPGLLDVDDVAADSALAGMQNAYITGSAIWPIDPAAGENNRPSIVPNLSSPLPAPRVARHPRNS